MMQRACCRCGSSSHNLSGCRWVIPLETPEQAAARVAAGRAKAEAEAAVAERLRRKLFYW